MTDNNSLLKNNSPAFDDCSKTLASLDNPKVSKLIMTKYEFDKIIGIRTTQIANGGIPFVKIDHNVKSNMELREVAIEELKQGKLPFLLERILPNNKSEFIRIRDLDLINVKYLMNI